MIPLIRLPRNNTALKRMHVTKMYSFLFKDIFNSWIYVLLILYLELKNDFEYSKTRYNTLTHTIVISWYPYFSYGIRLRPINVCGIVLQNTYLPKKV
jgi:hypothetical protein